MPAPPARPTGEPGRERLQADGGPLTEISSSARSLAVAVDRFGRVTLPRVNNAADDETAQAARRLGRTVSGIGDNPQSLIYGPAALPGPGELSFVAPAAQP